MLLPHARRRSNFDYKILVSYTLGTTIGALLTSLVVWILSGFAEPLGARLRAVLLITGAVFFLLCKHGPLAGVVKLPESRRQIPAEVFGGSLLRGAFRFGLELGTGVRTYVSSPAPYILLLTLFLGRLKLADAIFVGLGFGLGRAVPLMIQLLAANKVREENTFFRRSSRAASATAALLTLAGALILV